MKTFYSALTIFLLVCTLNSNAITTEDAIIEKMYTDYQLDTTDYEIEILTSRIKLKNIETEELSIKALTQKEPLGLFTVLVSIMKDGENVETSQVRMRIKKFKTVLITTDRLKRHTELTNSNTAVKRVEVTNLRSKPYLSVAETFGYRLKGAVKKQIPLTSSMLQKIPDIASGRETTIVYVGSVFKITAEGVALQSGSEGDFIKVKNKTSKKIIIARVIDSHHVAVDP